MALVVSAGHQLGDDQPRAYEIPSRQKQQGVVTRFPALFYPLGNWLCLLFMAAVLVIMLMTPGWRFPSG